DRPDIARARRAWRRRQAGWDPARLIFLDESGAKTNLTRLRGRAQRGQRLHAKSPQGHWHTTTMISSIRSDGSSACMAVDGAADTEVFQAYVRRVLCPTVRAGDIVIMDNLPPHKNELTLSLLTELGAQILFLPAYSPEPQSDRKNVEQSQSPAAECRSPDAAQSDPSDRFGFAECHASGRD